MWEQYAKVAHKSWLQQVKLSSCLLGAGHEGQAVGHEREPEAHVQERGQQQHDREVPPLQGALRHGALPPGRHQLHGRRAARLPPGGGQEPPPPDGGRQTTHQSATPTPPPLCGGPSSTRGAKGQAHGSRGGSAPPSTTPRKGRAPSASAPPGGAGRQAGAYSHQGRRAEGARGDSAVPVADENWAGVHRGGRDEWARRGRGRSARGDGRGDREPVVPPARGECAQPLVALRLLAKSKPACFLQRRSAIMHKVRFCCVDSMMRFQTPRLAQTKNLNKRFTRSATVSIRRPQADFSILGAVT